MPGREARAGGASIQMGLVINNPCSTILRVYVFREDEWYECGSEGADHEPIN